MFFRSDEEDRFAGFDSLFDDVDCIADLLHRLCEVDDVDPVPLFEDESLHLRVPTVPLVAKVCSTFKEFFDSYFNFCLRSQALSLMSFDAASSPFEEISVLV